MEKENLVVDLYGRSPLKLKIQCNTKRMLRDCGIYVVTHILKLSSLLINLSESNIQSNLTL
jgi:hypothetical protein